MMANRRGCERVFPLGVTRRRRADLLISTALQATTVLVLAFPAAAQPPTNAQPIGGSVVAGSATITQNSSTTTINQASQRAAINWQSFNVGSQQGVTFNQPSSSAIALNRVVGPDPSQIAGHIDANGQVVLVNQAGVIFYKGSQVNAQSVIVSSANIANASFMAGNMAFNQPGSPNAHIINQGTITVHQAGLAALVAPRVANSGTINARLGNVQLAGVNTATLDLYGDGLLSLDVTNQVTQAPVGRNGAAVPALVTNSGVIRADGGTVQLTAAAADGVVQNLVSAGGKIQANSVNSQTGTVTIAGLGGGVTVTGLVSAAGYKPGTTGGNVAINASSNVTLSPAARISASGAAGGGTVAIGTTMQRAKGGPGTASAMTAANVSIAQGAEINASATKSGNGGRVTVLSGNTTQTAGTITAQGGAQSGNGGFVEISGPTLNLIGPVDVSAPHGGLGTILLDPVDLAIIASTSETSSSVDSEFINGTLASGANSGSPPPSTISNVTLNSFQGNVTVQASGTIDVQASLNVGANLTLQAGGKLTVESTAPISAGGNILLQAGTTNPAGAIVINAPITAGDGQVQLISGTGGITLNANIISALAVDLNTTGGGVTQAITTGITASAIQSSNGVTGNVSLLGNNAVTDLNNFTVTPSGGPGTGNLQFVDYSGLFVEGNVSTPGGNVYIQGAGLFGIIVDDGTITTGATGMVSLQTDNFENASSIITGTFELAPITENTVFLGPSESEGVLALPSMAGISANLVRVGAITQPGSTSPTITTTNTITIVGTFDAVHTNFELDSTGTVDGTGSPLVNANTLSGFGGAVWSLPLSNSVTNIGTVNASSFTLNDTIGLNVTGPLNAGTLASITATGSLAIPGTVSATAVGLSADSITIPGLVTDGGAGVVALIANAGTISETGTLIAGKLEGTATGVADLLGSGPSVNQVATIGVSIIAVPGFFGFSASSFALRDGSSLKVAGPVVATSSGGQAFLSSTAAGGITIAATASLQADASTGTASLQTDFLALNGSIIANTVELAPATPGGTVTLGAPTSGLDLLCTCDLTANILRIGAVTEPGTTTPTITAGGITIAGTFNAGAVTTLELDASAAAGSGAITQSFPLINVGILTGNAASVVLNGTSNTVDTIGNFTATGGFALTNATDLIIAGTVSAGPSASFTVDGAITEAGGLIATALSGSSTGLALFVGNNSISQLNGFTVGSGGFTLHNNANIAISDTLSAMDIIVSAPASAISIGNGATIITGGSTRPAGSSLPTALLPSSGGPGALFEAASFTQTGISTVTGLNSGPATMEISVTGNIGFDPPKGLAGPATWLILDLTNGSATGQVFIDALDVIYTVPGRASLTGAISNVGGMGAAKLGFIHPLANELYTFNGCEITFACSTPSPGGGGPSPITSTPTITPTGPITPTPIVTTPTIVSTPTIVPTSPGTPGGPGSSPTGGPGSSPTPPIQIVSQPTGQTTNIDSSLLLQPLIPTETQVYVPVEEILPLLSPVLVLEPEDHDNLLNMPVVSRQDY
jgi:filamentous hemagglutinin family protein